MEAAKRINFTFNEKKSVIRAQEIDILGYRISHRSLKPDPDRMEPLRKLPIPSTGKELKRCIGMLAYYSAWIPRFSDRIRILNSASSFPLSS